MFTQVYVGYSYLFLSFKSSLLACGNRSYVLALYPNGEQVKHHKLYFPKILYPLRRHIHFPPSHGIWGVGPLWSAAHSVKKFGALFMVGCYYSVGGRWSARCCRSSG